MTIEIEAQDLAFDNPMGGMGVPFSEADVAMDDDGDEDVFVEGDFDGDFDDHSHHHHHESDEDGDESGDEGGMAMLPDQSELIFFLPSVPGADDDSEIVVEPEESELEVEPEEPVEVEPPDPWDWAGHGGHGGFLHWLQAMMENVPRHSGRDTTGLEKAISYFEALDKEITKAMRSDFKNEISSAKAEEARAQIEDGLERLMDRLERVRVTKYKRHAKKSKQNKKADEQNGMLVKEAQKATHVGGIFVSVPLFISRLARICINGMVSAGHDIERTFTKLSEKYDLTKREQAELLQLLADMGYPVRRDRGYDIDEDMDITSSDNFDWMANYPG
jgi:hypothetical protein